MFSCLLLAAILGQAPVQIPAAVEKEALDASLRISVGTKEGSGVLIGRDGDLSYALTAAHIVEGRDSANVALLTEPLGIKPLAAKVLKRTSIAGADLALLWIRDPQGRLLKREIVLAEKGRTPPFPAFSIGLPVADKGKIRAERTIAAPNVTKEKETARFWKCAEIPAEGRSGGPLVEGSGKLIGICSGGDDKAGYYTHIEEILDFVNSSGIAASLKK
jgi:S1-C subfamily serine protease